MHVLVWSDNHILADLVAKNLDRRGFDVHEGPLPPFPVRGATELDAPDLIVVDLDCLDAELWHRASLIRRLLPGVPLVVLGHSWPTSPRVDRLQPCAYVRKPFAIDALLAAVKDVTTGSCSSH
jgi:DNA-binding response OmpR family regulator